MQYRMDIVAFFNVFAIDFKLEIIDSIVILCLDKNIDIYYQNKKKNFQYRKNINDLGLTITI